MSKISLKNNKYSEILKHFEKKLENNKFFEMLIDCDISNLNYVKKTIKIYSMCYNVMIKEMFLKFDNLVENYFTENNIENNESINFEIFSIISQYDNFFKDIEEKFDNLLFFYLKHKHPHKYKLLTFYMDVDSDLYYTTIFFEYLKKYGNISLTYSSILGELYELIEDK